MLCQIHNSVVPLKCYVNCVVFVIKSFSREVYFHVASLCILLDCVNVKMCGESVSSLVTNQQPESQSPQVSIQRFPVAGTTYPVLHHWVIKNVLLGLCDNVDKDSSLHSLHADSFMNKMERFKDYLNLCSCSFGYILVDWN